MGYLRILGPILAFALLAGWGARVNQLRGEWQHKTLALVAVVAEVGGVDKLQVKNAGAKVREIGAARDRYRRARDAAQTALLDQTQRVVAMGEETARLRALSDRQAELVRNLTAQRDQWIKRAEQAATRVQRLSFEEEAQQCEEAMDALYQAGF